MHNLKISNLFIVMFLLVGLTFGQSNPKVTFIELGSVNCIPCKQMQPVMKAISAKYGGQVKVTFYDVWTPDGQVHGRQYGVRVIPTQVFLDKEGLEYFRHEGFFAKEELEKILIQGGARKKEGTE